VTPREALKEAVRTHLRPPRMDWEPASSSAPIVGPDLPADLPVLFIRWQFRCRSRGVRTRRLREPFGARAAAESNRTGHLRPRPGSAVPTFLWEITGSSSDRGTTSQMPTSCIRPTLRRHCRRDDSPHRGAGRTFLAGPDPHPGIEQIPSIVADSPTPRGAHLGTVSVKEPPSRDTRCGANPIYRSLKVASGGVVMALLILGRELGSHPSPRYPALGAPDSCHLHRCSTLTSWPVTRSMAATPICELVCMRGRSGVVVGPIDQHR
jgi:hypothetical protein